MSERTLPQAERTLQSGRFRLDDDDGEVVLRDPREAPGGAARIARGLGLVLVATAVLVLALADARSAAPLAWMTGFFGMGLATTVAGIDGLKRRAYGALPYLRVERTLARGARRDVTGYRTAGDAGRSVVVDGVDVGVPRRAVRTTTVIVVNGAGNVFHHAALVCDAAVVRVESFPDVEAAQSFTESLAVLFALPAPPGEATEGTHEPALEHSAAGMWGFAGAALADLATVSLSVLVASGATNRGVGAAVLGVGVAASIACHVWLQRRLLRALRATLAVTARERFAVATTAARREPDAGATPA